MKIDWHRVYTEVGALLAGEPDWAGSDGLQSPEALRWIGRAEALIRQTQDSHFFAEFLRVHGLLGSRILRNGGVDELRALLYRVHSLAEFHSPATVTGAFIPVGKPFDALVAIGKLLGEVTSDALIVDPYMDEKTLTLFAPSLPEGATLRLLADAQDKKASLKPAVVLWKQQYGESRPLELRLAPTRVLHDRLIVADYKSAWSLSQSLNAIAQRSPATILKADPETAAMKIAAFNDIWASSVAVE